MEPKRSLTHRSSYSSTSPSYRSRDSRSSFQSFATNASSLPCYDTPGTSPASSPRSNKSFQQQQQQQIPSQRTYAQSLNSSSPTGPARSSDRSSSASRRCSAPLLVHPASGDSPSPTHGSRSRPFLVPRPPKMQTDFFGLDLSFLEDEPPPPRRFSGGNYPAPSRRPSNTRRSSDLSFVTSDDQASSRRPAITLPAHRASVGSTGLTFPNATRPFPTRKPDEKYVPRSGAKGRSPSSASLNAFGRAGDASPPSPTHFTSSSESEEDYLPHTTRAVYSDGAERGRLAAYFDSAAEAMEGGKSLAMAKEELRSGTAPSSRRASRDVAAVQAQEVEEQKAKTAEKRRRTIKELCETERLYASDMAVVRDIFLTRARGVEMSAIADHVMSSGLGLVSIAEDEAPAFTPRVRSNSRQVSLTPSMSSRIERRRQELQVTHSLEYAEDPIMTAKDIHIVFANLEEIADLSEAFAAVLEAARGSDSDEIMDDTVGGVFAEMLPRIEQVYSTYCARHHRAIVRLQELEPSLRTYFAECRALSNGRTSAWDLASLLIKPVQRCLKYPLLLEQILAATPLNHPDRPDLILAKRNMLLVAENINEYKKRVDTVERSLASKRGSSSGGRETSFSLSKKLLRSGTKNKHSRTTSADSGERDDMFDTLAALVETTRSGVVRFSSEMRDWSRSTKGALEAQVTLVSGWIDLYAPIEGETAHHPSQRRLEVFLDDVLVPLIEGPFRELDYEIRRSLLSKTDHLLSLFDNPRQVISRRNDNKDAHQRYLSKKLPQDQHGSEDYVTLTTQLLDELPKFLASVSKYFNIVVDAFANLQQLYQESFKERWDVYADEWLTQIGKGDYDRIQEAFEDKSRDVTHMLATLVKSLGSSVSNAATIQARARREARQLQRESRESSSGTHDHLTPVVSPHSRFSTSSHSSRGYSTSHSRIEASRQENSLSSSESLQGIPTYSRPRIPQSHSHIISGYFDATSESEEEDEDEPPRQVLYYAQATSSSRSNAYRSGYPILSFMEGDTVAVELEEADSMDGGSGWLLARDGQGVLGWSRTEDFEVCLRSRGQ